MTYTVVVEKRFEKAFRKLDRPTQMAIKNWINKNLVDCEDPRLFGKPLVDNLNGMWRYRIGKYRVLCKIKDGQCIVVALNMGHRKEIY